MLPQPTALLTAVFVAGAASIAVLPDARGATKRVLYSFQGYPADGALPNGALLFWGGKVYGTTVFGGSGTNCAQVGGCGTAFSLTLNGVETVLHSFATVSGDGARPNGGLLEAKGALYGTTESGASDSCPYLSHGGCGTVFKMHATGAETVVYAFQWFYGPDGIDGAFPTGVTKLGNALYGATEFGGTGTCDAQPGAGCGIIFKVTLTGTETIAYSFQGNADGFLPSSGLTKQDGIFYGTTLAGGATGNGTIYSVTPEGTEKILYSFQGGSDGATPGNLLYVDGVFYGTTSAGGANGLGTVFSITPSGGYTQLHSFAGGNDGAYPNSLVQLGGKLYGTTNSGGAQNAGTVSRMSKTGAETSDYSFQGGSDGSSPNGLLNIQGTLYGTTSAGGTYKSGTVFQLIP